MTSSPTISARATAGLKPKPKAEEICPTCRQAMPHPRNKARLDLLFAILVPALHQWPEGAEFQPLSTEHLRSWLLCEAGHCDVDEVSFAGSSKAQIIAAVTALMNRRRRKGFVHYRATKDGIKALEAKSIAFANCSETTFKRVLERAIEIIEVTIGVEIEQLKREHEAAA